MGTARQCLDLKDGAMSAGIGTRFNNKPIDFIKTGNNNGMLRSGEGLKQGGRIYSNNRKYYLTLQDDGNVVLYKVCSGGGGGACKDDNDNNNIDNNDNDNDMLINNNNDYDNDPDLISVGADLVVVWASGVPEQPLDNLTHGNTRYDSYHGPYSLVMQHDGNFVYRYSREHCVLPPPAGRMVQTDTGFAYWVEDKTDAIVFPKIEEYSLGISNTENNPGAKLVVTDWGQLVVDGGITRKNVILWKRG